MVVVTRSRAASTTATPTTAGAGTTVAALLGAQEGTSPQQGPLNKRKKNKKNKKAASLCGLKGKAPTTAAVVGHLKRHSRYGMWIIVPITVVPMPNQGTGPAPTCDRVPNVRLHQIQPPEDQKDKNGPSP